MFCEIAISVFKRINVVGLRQIKKKIYFTVRPPSKINFQLEQLACESSLTEQIVEQVTCKNSVPKRKPNNWHENVPFRNQKWNVPRPPIVQFSFRPKHYNVNTSTRRPCTRVTVSGETCAVCKTVPFWGATIKRVAV